MKPPLVLDNKTRVQWFVEIKDDGRTLCLIALCPLRLLAARSWLSTVVYAAIGVMVLSLIIWCARYQLAEFHESWPWVLLALIPWGLMWIPWGVHHVQRFKRGYMRSEFHCVGTLVAAIGSDVGVHPMNHTLHLDAGPEGVEVFGNLCRFDELYAGDAQALRDYLARHASAASVPKTSGE